MSHFVSLYDAKTRLSALVDRAAAGEEIAIAPKQWEATVTNDVPTRDSRVLMLPSE